MDLSEVWKLPFVRHLILVYYNTDQTQVVWNWSSLVGKTFDENINESHRSYLSYKKQKAIVPLVSRSNVHFKFAQVNLQTRKIGQHEI